ncbi:MAG: Plug domain-containing protein, partial [Chitinophagaceae bacterium]|nr:Plug domain-containing protein [Chitinophagaceae bacterium]
MKRIARSVLLLFFTTIIYYAADAQLIESSTDTSEIILHSKDEKEVIVHGNSRRNRAINEMSIVSSRAFSVEETRRYAAAVNDPLRMATAFPGVVGTSDGQNNISIRGNAPTGLLWKMEGVDIPNPNHFSSPGGAGGGISILSAQLLANSDFVTGAFAAEYGNAVGGAFDLKLRKGNSDKRQYVLEAGLLGLNVAAEGPIAPFYKGSYLVNYRYSTLSLLGKMGMDVGTGNTDFQDLSYNIYIPTARLGSFTIFGFTGLSSQSENPEMDATKWESDFDRYSGKFVSNTIVNGITHTAAFNNRMNLKSALSYSNTRQKYNENYVEDDSNLLNSYK